MAINKIMRAALAALSYPSFDLKKNYKLQRKIVSLTHPPYLKRFYKNWEDRVMTGEHKIPVRIFSPPQEGNHPILLFFHGGGWVSGDIDSYTNVCTNMAIITNRRVISVDYRLAPEHRFPAGLMDCYAVAREVFQNADKFNITPQEITLIGDSAGANLVAAVSLMARDKREFFPKQQILIYPSTSNDHSDNSPFASVVENKSGFLLTTKKIRDYMELYRSSKEDLKNPYFAPLEADSLENQPDTLIITAQYDPLRDEGEGYGKRLRDAGNRVEIYRIEDALHGFFSLPPIFSQVKDCYHIINRFLSKGLQKSKNS